MRKEGEAMTLTDRIVAYETEGLSDAEFIKLFQDLINNGMAWTLQGSYGRTAKALIDNGKCHLAK